MSRIKGMHLDNLQIKIAYTNNKDNLDNFLQSINVLIIKDPELRRICIATLQSINILRENLEKLPDNVFNLSA